MKRTFRLAAVAGGCLLLASVAIASLADPVELGKKVAASLRGNMSDPGAMQAGMEKWQETMKKGPAHEFLQAAFVGEWDVETKFWMDPKGEPMASTGTSSCKAILDGRYIREQFKGDVMGQPFEGESTTGFDNNRKLFFSTWIDSMSTAMMKSHGSISEDGKMLTFVGEMDEPMTGEVGKAVQSIITIESADKHKMEMFEILYGKPFKVMELTYTRRNGNAAAGRE